MGIENQPKSFMEWVKKIRSHGKVFHDEGLYHIETSPLIWKANQWFGFYMKGTFAMKVLNAYSDNNSIGVF